MPNKLFELSLRQRAGSSQQTRRDRVVSRRAGQQRIAGVRQQGGAALHDVSHAAGEEPLRDGVRRAAAHAREVLVGVRAASSSRSPRRCARQVEQRREGEVAVETVRECSRPSAGTTWRGRSACRLTASKCHSKSCRQVVGVPRERCLAAPRPPAWTADRLTPGQLTWLRDKGRVPPERNEWSCRRSRASIRRAARPEIALYQGARLRDVSARRPRRRRGGAFARRSLDDTNHGGGSARAVVDAPGLMTEAIEGSWPRARAAGGRRDAARAMNCRASYEATRARSEWPHITTFCRLGQIPEVGARAIRRGVAAHHAGAARALGVQRARPRLRPRQFAEFIAAELPAIDYAGVDFSAVAVSRAPAPPAIPVREARLPIAEFASLPPFDAVVCTGRCSNTSNVIGDPGRAAAETFVVASVPNFDSGGRPLRSKRGRSA